MKKAVIIGSSEAYQADPKTNSFAVSAPPLSILAVGSYLAAHDVPVDVIDIEMDFGVGRDRRARCVVAQRVARYLHDQAENIAWVGLSLHSNLSLGMIEGRPPIIDEVHAALPVTPLVFGGYFASSEYHVLLKQYPFAAVVRGNGEAPAVEISCCLAEGRSFLSDRTPNMAWLEDGEIRANPVQSPALNTFPILDFRLLRHPRCYQKIDLLTSRGCPFTCDYCFENVMRPYDAYALDWISRQLDHVKAVTPNTRLFVFDPIFGIGRERTLAICELLTGRGFSWGFLGRADVLPPDTVPALYAAGVRTIFFGIEALSTPALLRMKKVRSAAMARKYVESALAIITACFENDVTPFIGIMLGYPGDRESDYLAVLSFFDELNRIHDQCARKPGLYILPMVTKIYDNSPLAERAAMDFPGANFKAGPLTGERFATLRNLDANRIESYVARIAGKSIATRTALGRLSDFWMRSAGSLDAFLAAHPELTDGEGVLFLPGAARFDDFCPAPER